MFMFIFSQSFTIDYMSRDLWHYSEPPYSSALIIPLLKVSDCTEIITHEMDSGIALKDLGMSGGFVQ